MTSSLVKDRQVLTTIICYRLIAEQFAGVGGSDRPQIGLSAGVSPGRSFFRRDVDSLQNLVGLLMRGGRSRLFDSARAARRKNPVIGSCRTLALGNKKARPITAVEGDAVLDGLAASRIGRPRD